MHMCALCLIPKLVIQFGKRMLSHLVQEPISYIYFSIQVVKAQEETLFPRKVYFHCRLED